MRLRRRMQEGNLAVTLPSGEALRPLPVEGYMFVDPVMARSSESRTVPSGTPELWRAAAMTTSRAWRRCRRP